MDRAREIQGLVVIRPAREDFLGLDVDRCTGCAQCAIVCPALLWKMSHGKAALADDYRARCLECAGCYQICDARAIRFHYPGGGEGIVVSQG